jgi:hypothetical protein
MRIKDLNDLKMMKNRELLNVLSSKQYQFSRYIILYLSSQSREIKNNKRQETLISHVLVQLFKTYFYWPLLRNLRKKDNKIVNKTYLHIIMLENVVTITDKRLAYDLCINFNTSFNNKITAWNMTTICKTVIIG